MSLDVAIVGGGLSGGILAYRLMQTNPHLALAVFESGPVLGGKHVWSFHGTDVSKEQLEWLWPLISQSWPSHDVAFSNGPRRIGGGYHSIKSPEFHDKISSLLGERLRLNCGSVECDSTSVRLLNGETVEAKCVIDARGLSSVPFGWKVGFQRFLGLHVRLKKPHALEVPLIMDTRVEQLGTFRFVYVLPWSSTHLHIEDTAYADTPEVDAKALRERIEAYAQSHQLEIDEIVDSEMSALPIPLNMPCPTFSMPTIGMKAGFFHATTGYSLPQAVEIADFVAARIQLTCHELLVELQEKARTHHGEMGFFRMLNRMLFLGAASADERVKIFEAFYGLNDERIAHFYSGKLTWGDKLDVLNRGRPSVPFFRAMKASFGI
jgi:lycopene beta-cyclase